MNGLVLLFGPDRALRLNVMVGRAGKVPAPGDSTLSPPLIVIPPAVRLPEELCLESAVVRVLNFVKSSSDIRLVLLREWCGSIFIALVRAMQFSGTCARLKVRTPLENYEQRLVVLGGESRGVTSQP